MRLLANKLDIVHRKLGNKMMAGATRLGNKIQPNNNYSNHHHHQHEHKEPVSDLERNHTNDIHNQGQVPRDGHQLYDLHSKSGRNQHQRRHNH